MQKIRIKNSDLYRIEVNDKGEYIEFDLSDIGLPFKCYETLESIKKIQDEMVNKEKDLKSKIKNDNNPFSKERKELAFLECETFKKMRLAMDNFLGEGACQKIFGDRNYYEMFDDLLEEFTKPRKELNGKSHFDLMNLKSSNIDDRIVHKYNKLQKRVI